MSQARSLPDLPWRSFPMNRFARLVALTLATLTAFTAAPLFAQAPRVGDYYEDKVDLGFKVRMPKDWEFTPPQPGERHVIGKYTPAYNRFINISPENVLWLEAYMVRFDRRPKKGSKDEKKADIEIRPGKDDEDVDYSQMPRDERHIKLLTEWLDGNVWGNGFRVKKQKDTKVKKVPSTELLFSADDNGDEFHTYAMAYELAPDLDVAIVFNGPADKMKWRKYEVGCKKMAKSFQRVKVEQLELSDAKDTDSGLRSLKRAELEMEVAKSNDWKLYETENYFIISNNDDRDFMKELKERLEAIRAVYEEMYPFDEAARIQVAAQKREREERKKNGEEEPESRETTSDYSSQQRSQCSVVRVCKNQTQYHEYGGPGGSAGYWASFHEELVIFDDQAGGGRRDTWAVLNHEAFHQYIFYLYGSIAPHSWYNEGTGDYFAGYEYKHKKFKLKPFAWRKDTIKSAIKADEHVPLENLVRFTQREYYGNNDFNASGGQNYAQGWSFIYFLRTGQGKAPKWNSEWEKILDVYFETLAATGELDEAVDAAFAGVDFEAMEESWKAYTLK